MQVREGVEMAGCTTLRVGGPARFFVQAGAEDDVLAAFEKAGAEGLRLAVLGGGSNLLVPDAGYDGLVLRLGMQGVEREGDRFDVAGGESWDNFVEQTVRAGYAGVECLAGIPGTVGASPVQNIGAYGQEVAQTIESVRAFDRRLGTFVELEASACRFRYRRSVFNTEERDRYVITRVRFCLRPGGEPHLRYADLERWFSGWTGTPGLGEVAAAVRSIRSAKGMVLAADDPDTWSAGSYFKNPVVPAALAADVAAKSGQGEVPQWPAGDGCVKLSAAFLMERAGFGRGYRMGRAGLSTKHALALTNRGGATCAELLQLEGAIRGGVWERFGVGLEREPVFLGC